MSADPKPPTDFKVEGKKPLIGTPIKIFAFSIFALLGGTLLYGALSSTPRQPEVSAKPASAPISHNLYQDILSGLKSKGVSVAKDVADGNHTMVFLTRSWQSVDFTEVAGSGDTFYLSDPFNSEVIEFGFWFHFSLDASEQVRLAAANEINQLMPVVIRDPTVLTEFQGFLTNQLKNIPSDTEKEIPFRAAGIEATLAASQDQQSKFLVRLNMKLAK